MKQTKLKLLKLLRKNPRLSYRKLSNISGISPSTIARYVDSLESEEVIRGYKALIDYEKLGYKLKVLISVRSAKGKLEEIEKKLIKSPNVDKVFDITGNFDAMAIARFQSREKLSKFVKNLLADENIERTETQLVLNTLEGDIEI